MSNLWINIRFGSWHFQVGPENFGFHKSYWIRSKDDKWFEIYEPFK